MELPPPPDGLGGWAEPSGARAGRARSPLRRRQSPAAERDAPPELRLPGKRRRPSHPGLPQAGATTLSQSRSCSRVVRRSIQDSAPVLCFPRSRGQRGLAIPAPLGQAWEPPWPAGLPKKLGNIAGLRSRHGVPRLICRALEAQGQGRERTRGPGRHRL